MPCLFWENDTLFARAKHRLGRRDNRTLALPACRLFSEFRATRALSYFSAKLETTRCLDRLSLEDNTFLPKLSKRMSVKIVLPRT